jgi:hypothetical protein
VGWRVLSGSDGRVRKQTRAYSLFSPSTGTYHFKALRLLIASQSLARSHTSMSNRINSASKNNHHSMTAAHATSQRVGLWLDVGERLRRAYLW